LRSIPQRGWIVRYGLWFILVYIFWWVFFRPPVEALVRIRPRMRELRDDMARWRSLDPSARSRDLKVQPSASKAVGYLEAVFRASGLEFERIDPDIKAEDRGQQAYIVQMEGHYGQLAKFFDRSMRTNPRVMVKALRLRSTDRGVQGQLHIVVKHPGEIVNAKRVNIWGRDPFHFPPPPQSVRPPVPSMPVLPPPPPPPPEPVVMLNLKGINWVRDLRFPEAPPQAEALVENELTRVAEILLPTSYPGMEMEFLVDKGIIIIKRHGRAIRTWKIGESLNARVLKLHAEGRRKGG